MRAVRTHGKVWLWWSDWWAVQWVNRWQELALGVRFIPERWCLDIYVGPLTVAVGRNPIHTPATFRYRSICRGFIVEGTPEEAFL